MDRLKDEAAIILEAYQTHLREDGKSDKTIQSYVTDVKGFLEWLSLKQVQFTGTLSRLYVTSYKEYIQTIHSIHTINKKINSLNSFCQYLVSCGYQKEQVIFPAKDKIKIASGSEQQVEVFTEQEVERLLFYLESSGGTSHRDKLMVLLLLYTGVRVSELVSIKIADLDLLALTIKVVGKGGKYRVIPMKMELSQSIRTYLDGERRGHKHVKSEYLLLTQRSDKMDKDTVNKVLNRIGQNLNLVMKPHKFRHTFCTRLLHKGAELTTVAKLAGHANIQTTATFYINTSHEEKQQAVALL